MVSIEIAPILDWAWAILQFAINWVWIFCIMVAGWILWKGAIDQADEVVKGKGARKKPKVSRTKE